jgi:phosphate transport system permease protein
MIKNKSHALGSMAGITYSFLAMAMIICVLGFIIIVLLKDGASVLSWHFISTQPDPSALSAANGGILTPIIGTAILTVIGIVIAYPFALATSIYLSFYAKKGLFRTLVESAVDILSGIPTVVMGLFALVVFTMPQFAFLSTRVEVIEGVSRAYGRSFLVAGITMAIMILPFIIKEHDGGAQCRDADVLRRVAGAWRRQVAHHPQGHA